jgi:hypothetical protein
MNNPILIKMVIYILVLLFYTFIYWMMPDGDLSIGEDIDGTKNIWDCLYFATITQTTVGYGHVFPNTVRGKIIVISHCLLSVALLFINEKYFATN